MDLHKNSSAWMKRSLDDLRWTEANIRECIYYGACFTAQQAVEKALKSYLLAQGEQTRKIHDISALLEMCIKHEAQLGSLRETILPLTDYYVQTRYPDIGEFMEYTKIMADDALLRSREVVLFVQKFVATT